MKKLRTPCLAVALAASLAGARHAGAGPSVVRDESLTDVGTTPVLGRGYSLATNTFQSICMKEIVKTKPSYDFKYKFEQIEESAAEEIKRSGSFEAAFGANYGFFRVSGRMRGNMKSNTKTETKTVNIVVTIDVDTYYQSMDETRGELADNAVQLAKQDLPAFFDACGMYYVRSINRNSKIFALFTFDHRSEAQDQEFAAQLEAEIRGWGWSGSMRSSMSSQSKSNRESTNLKIVTNAQGLGKISGTSLLAYDLDSFRKAVQTAFLATQDEDVGRVTSIEIVPWVEHLQFQALMLGNSNYTVDGKRNMLINSEFLAEVDRAARAKLNGFYRAKQCRAGIESDFRTYDTSGQSTWALLGGTSLGDASISSHRPGGTSRKLSDLWSALVPEKVQVMYNEYDAFMYGGKDDLPVVVQNGRRTYRYDLDASPVVPPTGANRADWAQVARTALTTTPNITPPDAWLLAYGKAYLRGNGQTLPAGDHKTLEQLVAALPAQGETLTTPFTEQMVYLDGTERKTQTFQIANKTDVVNGVWRLVFNNPASVIESKDGWFGFAAAAILDNDEFAKQFVKLIRGEIENRTELKVEEKEDVRSLGKAYADKVEEALRERPGAYPSFAALAQAAVARVLQGTTEQLGAVNADPIVTAYLLKQLKTFAPDYLMREAKRLKLASEADSKLDDDKEWATAKKIYDQYKLLASQGGSMSLGSAGFFGSAEYVGAARCVRDLLRDNRFMKESYRTIESCRRVESQLGTVRSTIVEDYCLPKLDL